MKFYRIRLRVVPDDWSKDLHPQLIIGAPTEEEAIKVAKFNYWGSDAIDIIECIEITPRYVVASQVYNHSVDFI